jgi:RND family efflux transporter MFP subunit
VLETGSLSSTVINAEIPLINAQEDLDDVMNSETPKAQAYNELKEKEKALADAEHYAEGLKYPRALADDIMYYAEQVEIYRKYYEEAQRSFDDAALWKNGPTETELNFYDERRKARLTALDEYAEAYNNYLYYSGSATENDKEQAAAKIDVAEAEYEKALKNFMTYSVYPRTKDIAAAEVKLQNARNTYNRRNIVADINGTVTTVSARPGDYVKKGDSAFQLDNITKLYVPMDVSEIDVLKIRDGTRALIVFDANPDHTYEGIVSSVSASGESSGNRVTFGTMVEILDPDDKVKVGMTAEVKLILDESENTLLVPANAVFYQNGSSYVTVVDGTIMREFPVRVGLVTDTVAEILGGDLQEGDLVRVPSVDNSILKDMGLNETAQVPDPDRMPFAPFPFERENSQPK